MKKQTQNNVFGERLKIFRIDHKKMTQKEFAEFIGIPQPTLSAYECGKNSPTIDTVMDIAKKCNISIDWLCGKDNTHVLNSLGDLANLFFEIFESNDLTLDVVNNDSDTNKTKTNINEHSFELKIHTNAHGKDSTASLNADVCNMLYAISELHQELIHYDCSYRFYTSERQRIINDGRTTPITQKNYPNIPEWERRANRIELLKKELTKN